MHFVTIVQQFRHAKGFRVRQLIVFSALLSAGLFANFRRMSMNMESIETWKLNTNYSVQNSPCP